MKKKITKSSSHKSRRFFLWALVVLSALISIIAYLPAVNNGFVWDDRQLIVENEQLIKPGAIWSFFTQDFWESEESVGTSDYYRPLVMISYTLDRHLYGLKPIGYHITNLIIHAICTGLLFLLVYKMGVGMWQCFFSAVLFGSHPVLAENVAWISGRTDTLATLFIFGCLLLDYDRQKIPQRIISLLLFIAALFSKEIAIVTPLLAMGLAWVRGDSFSRAALKRIDMILIIAIYLILRSIVLGSPISDNANLGGGLEWLTWIAAIPHLFGLFILPNFARIEYGMGLPPAPLLPAAGAGLILLMVLCIFAIRNSRNSRERILIALIACALLSFIPALASIVLKGVVGTRLIYLTSAFISSALVIIAVQHIRREVSLIMGVIIIIVFSVMSWTKSTLWVTEKRLFEAAASAPYPSARVHLNLGIAYHEEGMLLESLNKLETALRQEDLKNGHYMLGLLYAEIGYYDLAENHYRAALKIDPAYESAANNLGAMLAESGQTEEAEKVLVAALNHIHRKSPSLERNLELVRSGDIKVRQSPNVTTSNPEEVRERLTDARFLNRRALDRLRIRQLKQAHILIQAALNVDPNLTAAWLNLAQWHILNGEKTEARAVLEKILATDPNNESAQNLLSYL